MSEKEKKQHEKESRGIKKQPLRCPQCGAELKEDDIFCTNCGTPVPEVNFSEDVPLSPAAVNEPEIDEEEDIPEPIEAKRRKKLPPAVIILSVIALSLIIILAALIAAHVMDRNSGPEIVTGPVDSSQDYEAEGYGDHVHTSPVIETPPADAGAIAAPGAASGEAAGRIDERREGIDAGIKAGTYSRRKVSEQLTSFDEGGPVAKIIFEINNDQGSDRREYYYEDGALIYANREWKNSDEFYFEDGKMIRWVHTGSDGLTEIRDNLTVAEYQSKAENVLEEGRKYYKSASEALQSVTPESAEPQEENKPEENKSEEKPSGNKHSTSDDYMLPDSNSRYIDKSELAGFSAWECMVARNEIFARRGRIFTNADLKAHFESKSWYKPRISPDDFDSSVFNDYELQNIDTILQYEQAKGFA